MLFHTQFYTNSNCTCCASFMLLFLADPDGESPGVGLSSPSSLPATAGEVSAKVLVLKSGTCASSSTLFRSLGELPADNLTFWEAVGVAAAVVDTPCVLASFFLTVHCYFLCPILHHHDVADCLLLQASSFQLERIFLILKIMGKVNLLQMILLENSPVQQAIQRKPK